MQVQYSKLGNGDWMVEAWMWDAEGAMRWGCVFHQDRHTASWLAVQQAAGLDWRPKGRGWGAS